ncbi:MAG: PAS domain S-box protein [Alphaproteobacteria bacterium]|nr:PAS domain S-box protein [Alphaproteobacteria bacterium]
MTFSDLISVKKIDRKVKPLSQTISTVESSLLGNFQKEKLIINKDTENFLQIFLQNVPAAVAIFDKSMNYMFVSNRWGPETQLNRKDIIGKCHYDIVPDLPSKWKKLHAKCLAGEHFKCPQDVFRREDGTIEWLRWEIIPWYRNDCEVGGLVMFVEHITKHKALEEKMMGMIKTLNQSNAELEKFAHICAHDLNEPLRTIANYSRILEQEYTHELSYEAKRCLHNITKSVKHMNTLVNGILAYSQFGASSLTKNFFSLEQVVNSVKLVLEKKIKDKKAFIYVDGNPKIYGDMVLIARVLQNLINNALKFNESDMPIVYISVKEKKSYWLFCVEDNGIGIQRKYYKKIFDLFSRLHPPSRYKGTGIGLSVSKKIIEVHGGKIWVKSLINSGTQFLFTLPKTSEKELVT